MKKGWGGREEKKVKEGEDSGVVSYIYKRENYDKCISNVKNIIEKVRYFFYFGFNYLRLYFFKIV